MGVSNVCGSLVRFQGMNPHTFPQPPSPPDKRVKPWLGTMPGVPLTETERILPSFFIYIVWHVNIPCAPSPGPAWVWDLGVGNIDRTVTECRSLPRWRVEIQERIFGVKGNPAEECTTLVLVKDVNEGVIFFRLDRVLLRPERISIPKPTCACRIWFRILHPFCTTFSCGLISTGFHLIVISTIRRVFLPLWILPPGKFLSQCAFSPSPV